METNYIQLNKQLWNNKVSFHLNSEFYDVPNFLKGKSSLNSIELAFLNDLKDKKVLHLQCHFGQDSISLSRMGAKVTGIDLSDKAIESALELNKQANTDAQFICTDIYNLKNVLNEQFDYIFTSYGTIGWLPDMDKWADIIQHFLKPNGRFVFVEFHPVVWMFDDDFKKVGYNYFNDSPIIETSIGTYADKSAPIKDECVMWNHSMSEVITALVSNGLTLLDFQEYNYSPYNCFNETEEFEKGKFRIKHLKNNIPMVYSIVASK